jgi:hypothetical protein
LLRHRAVALALLMGIGGCSPPAPPPPPAEAPCIDGRSPSVVTVSQLLHRDPVGLCDGRVVRVKGFLRWEFEGQRLYASREDAVEEIWGLIGEHRRVGFADAIWIRAGWGGSWVDEIRFDQQDVIVEGRYTLRGWTDLVKAGITADRLDYASVEDAISAHALASSNFLRLDEPPPPPPIPGRTFAQASKSFVLNSPVWWLTFEERRFRFQ